MAVRTCVIFNPTARGEKATRFRKHLDAIGGQCTLKMTGGLATRGGWQRRPSARDLKSLLRPVVTEP
jgi:hypothetical protein